MAEVEVDGDAGEGSKGKGKVNGQQEEGSVKQVRWKVESSRRNEPVVLIEDLGSSNGTWVSTYRPRPPCIALPLADFIA